MFEPRENVVPKDDGSAPETMPGEEPTERAPGAASPTARLGYLMLDAARALHTAHLQTRDLTYHRELKDIYEGLDEDGDAVVESVEGAEGETAAPQTTVIQPPRTPDEVISLLDALAAAVNKDAHADRGVRAVLDACGQHLNSWRFLVRQCRE